MPDGGAEVPTHYVAQLNIARAIAPFDDPVMADFMARLDVINSLGDASPGFVWRLQGEGGTSTEIQVSDDPLFIVNLTVWDTIESLYEFTYRSEHRTVFKRRFDWFERRRGANNCLWWQPAGTVPTVEEARRRLQYLDDHGPTPEAFTFKQRFPAPQPSA